MYSSQQCHALDNSPCHCILCHTPTVCLVIVWLSSATHPPPRVSHVRSCWYMSSVDVAMPP